MIKTHKPRGHCWTNASAFQQSREIRNIHYDDCTPPPAGILKPESEVPAAKRRKIEKLADDFLNGEPLKISCCRPTFANQRTTIEWNERSRLGQKWHLPAPEDLGGNFGDEDCLWVDAEDPWKAFARPPLRKAERAGAKAGTAVSRVRRSTSARRPVNEATSAVEVQVAQSGCKAFRSRAGPSLSTEPSTAAMKQAAALRARKLDRATTEEASRICGGVPDQDSPVERLGPEVTHSAPASAARPRYFRTRKPAGTEWLLRRNTVLHEVSFNESMDELSRSVMDTNTPTKSQGQASIPGYEMNEQAVSHFHGNTQQLSRDQIAGPAKSSADPLSLSFSQRMAAVSVAGASVRLPSQTAEDDTDDDDTPVNIQPSGDSQEDSQARLLNKHGLRSRSRTSWTAMNDTHHTDAVPVPQPSIEAPSSDSSASAFRQAIQQSAENASRPKRGKRAKSAANAEERTASDTRRQSAPTASQAINHQPQEDGQNHIPVKLQPDYSQKDSINAGDTPFMFRKRRGRTSKASGASNSTTATAKTDGKVRKPVEFLSSDEEQNAQARKHAEHTELLATNAPQLDLSLTNDTSFARNLNMALVDEHLNARLPNEPGSDKRSSAVKKALRKSMQEAGAVVERLSGEPLSSQGAAPVSTGDAPLPKSSTGHDDGKGNSGRESLRSAIEVARRESLSTAQEPWLGTQDMLYQAQRDLFGSLQEQSASSLNLDETPEATRASTAPADDSAARLPLRELSQEQLPSTQQVMGTWSPWTAMKKKPQEATTATASESPMPSESPIAPTPAARATRASKSRGRLPTSAKHLVNEGIEKGRRSSLRFSMTNPDSPLRSSRLDFPITKSSSGDDTAKKGSFQDEDPTPKATHNPSKCQSVEHAEPSASTFTTLIPAVTPRGNDRSSTAMSCSAQDSSLEHGQGHLVQAQHAPHQHPSLNAATTEPLTSFGADQSETLRRLMSGHMSQGSLDRTIDDLAQEVLRTSTEDLAGVLSQPGA